MSKRRMNPIRALLMAAVLVTVLAAAAGATEVRVAGEKGARTLQVDGRDMMIFGMNWDHVPIGENYMWSLWTQPDDVIKTALDREMPLLQAMHVNVIRHYNGIPPKWVRYIYENFGIWTIVNHPMARYGYNLDGVWVPSVDYSDPRLRAAVKAEIQALVDEFEGTPGMLMWLLGNENNYGLHWASAEVEALPEGQRDAARARHLYSMFGEMIDAIKERDKTRPVAIANGDVQYIDIIAEECANMDVFGTNVYRGISVRDMYQVVEDKLQAPVLFTEFGADAFNARDLQEDQAAQAFFLLGQWREIYEQSAGKGRVGNAIGGCIFQWSDGWWKFGQDSRLEVHDTNASWPNAGYPSDYVEGDNNMNEEWWGITAKGRPDHRGLYEVYPRAAYYSLQEAFALDPYGKDVDIDAIRAHYDRIMPAVGVMKARGDKAALESQTLKKARLSGLRMEFETYSTGGQQTTTPPIETPASSVPAFRGFDHMQSFYADFEANPSDAVQARLSLNILGHVAKNPIDQIFYEGRGYRGTVTDDNGDIIDLEGLSRVKVYQGAVSWDDRWFQMDAFYRTGHTHWGYEGDFFGLYRDAYYGENIDIYNGEAPIGVEFSGKKSLRGLKVAFGPQLWWGANPAVILKYTRDVLGFEATAMFQEDFAQQTTVTSSVAIPEPSTRKATLMLATDFQGFGVEMGGIWSGSTKVGDPFQITGEQDGQLQVFDDTIQDKDAFGAKVKLTRQKGPWNWYGQAAYMGLVADGGPTSALTFTGWTLKDCGSGNQYNAMTGVAYNTGNWQIAPNFLWQKPVVDPIDLNAPAPARLRNILDDPFAVRANRETIAGELLIVHDPTPASWMWAWDSDIREDAKLAWSLGYTFRHMPTSMDAAIGIMEDGSLFAFPNATPARDLWEVRGRVVSRLNATTRFVGHMWFGPAEPTGDSQRKIERFGVDGRIAFPRVAFEAAVKVNDWGPYDYHRDYNLTFPLQLMGDVSYSLGTPRWFGYPQTRLGVRGTWRSLDRYSPRYLPDGYSPLPDGELFPEGLDKGSEWEIRTYLHVTL